MCNHNDKIIIIMTIIIIIIVIVIISDGKKAKIKTINNTNLSKQRKNTLQQ